MDDQIDSHIPPPSQVATLEPPSVERPDAAPPWEDERPVGESAQAIRARYAPAEAALRARGRKASAKDVVLWGLVVPAFLGLLPLRESAPLFPLWVAYVFCLTGGAYTVAIGWAAAAVSPRLPLILFGGWAACLVVGFALFAMGRPETTIALLIVTTQQHLRLAWLAYSPGGRVLYTPEYQAAIAATPGFELPPPRPRRGS